MAVCRERIHGYTIPVLYSILAILWYRLFSCPMGVAEKRGRGVLDSCCHICQSKIEGILRIFILGQIQGLIPKNLWYMGDVDHVGYSSYMPILLPPMPSRFSPFPWWLWHPHSAFVWCKSAGCLLPYTSAYNSKWIDAFLRRVILSLDGGHGSNPCRRTHTAVAKWQRQRTLTPPSVVQINPAVPRTLKKGGEVNAER